MTATAAISPIRPGEIIPLQHLERQLGISRWTWRTQFAQRCPSIMIGKRRYVRTDDVLRVLDEKLAAAGGETVAT